MGPNSKHTQWALLFGGIGLLFLTIASLIMGAALGYSMGSSDGDRWLWVLGSIALFLVEIGMVIAASIFLNYKKIFMAIIAGILSVCIALFGFFEISGWMIGVQTQKATTEAVSTISQKDAVRKKSEAEQELKTLGLPLRSLAAVQADLRYYRAVVGPSRNVLNRIRLLEVEEADALRRQELKNIMDGTDATSIAGDPTKVTSGLKASEAWAKQFGTSPEIVRFWMTLIFAGLTKMATTIGVFLWMSAYYVSQSEMTLVKKKRSPSTPKKPKIDKLENLDQPNPSNNEEPKKPENETIPPVSPPQPKPAPFVTEGGPVHRDKRTKLYQKVTHQKDHQ